MGKTIFYLLIKTTISTKDKIVLLQVLGNLFLIINEVNYLSEEELIVSTTRYLSILV